MERSEALKKNIRQVMGKVNDTHVLEAVYLLLEREARHETEMLSPLYVPSEDELAAIEEGYMESEKGETVSHDQLKSEMERKYSLWALPSIGQNERVKILTERWCTLWKNGAKRLPVVFMNGPWTLWNGYQYRRDYTQYMTKKEKYTVAYLQSK
jgi:hypothetical protein